MNILITGAAGGIGSTLAYSLYKAGHKLDLIDNFRNGYKQNLKINNESFGHFHELDICDTKLNFKLKKNYDCIIHLAAITALPDCESNPQETIDINVGGTSNILECAKSWGTPHVIFASTSAVYENNTESLFTEDLEINPRLWYSLSKKMGEELCKSYRKNYNIPITTLRFFNVFGPRQDIHRKNPPLLNYMVGEIKNNRAPTFHGDGKQVRDYVHVDDVVKCVKLCLNQKPNDTFNVCTGTLLSVNDIFNYVSNEYKFTINPVYKKANMLWDSYPSLFSGYYPLLKDIVEKETTKYSKGSFEKAKNILNWVPDLNLEYLIKKVSKEIIL